MRSYTANILIGRKAKKVTISAPNPESAREQAARQGQVLSLKQAGGGGWGKMSLSDRQVFCQRLSSMIASKVGTSEALDIMYQSFSGTVRDAAGILRDRIVNGESLADAMASAGTNYFPDVMVAIVRTGAQGGDLAYAIKEAARFEKELSEVKRESGKGIMSALTGFIAGVITILASTIYVAPMIVESSLVKASGGADIGWVMDMAWVITAAAIFVAAVVGGLFIFGVVLRPFAPAMVDRGIMRLPFYRDMALAKTNYMVFFGLAVLLKAGLRVEEALQLTISGAPKGELKNDLMRALNAIQKGSAEPWPYAMTMLHATDKAALATAQDRAQTAKTIEELAVQYQQIYRSRLGLFVPTMQMFAALFLSLAGFVLFGVSVIPLMQSTSNIMKML